MTFNLIVSSCKHFINIPELAKSARDAIWIYTYIEDENVYSIPAGNVLSGLIRNTPKSIRIFIRTQIDTEKYG